MRHDWGHCVVFKGKTLHSHKASVQLRVSTGHRKSDQMLVGSPGMGLASYLGNSGNISCTFHLFEMQTLPF